MKHPRTTCGRGAIVAAIPAMVAAMLVAAAPAVAEATAEPDPVAVSKDAFEYAFGFASAIGNDPKDRAMAQESVILTEAMSGRLDRAVGRAKDVDGWRQGTIRADLAVMLAKQGRRDDAAGLLADAMRVRDEIDGWQRGRIEAHAAQALALLGDDDRAHEIATRLAKGDIQYVGRSVATVAAAHAVDGDFDEAMKAMATLDGETDYEVTWWRTLGYLDLAEIGDPPAERRRAALDAALRSTETIPGWKRGEALQRVAEALVLHGDAARARTALENAEEAIAGMSDTTPVKGPLYCDIARVWAAVGEHDRAVAVVDRAKKAIAGAMLIERPAIYAEIASAYFVIGERERAREFYDSALTRAEALVNARPRALALTAICASMGRHGFEPDEPIRSRLDRQLAGLRAPW